MYNSKKVYRVLLVTLLCSFSLCQDTSLLDDSSTWETDRPFSVVFFVAGYRLPLTHANADKLTAKAIVRPTLSRPLRLDGALHVITRESYLSVLPEYDY